MKSPIINDSVEALNRDMVTKNLGGHWQLGLESYASYPGDHGSAISVEMAVRKL